MDGSHRLTTSRLTSDLHSSAPGSVVHRLRATHVCRGPLFQCGSRAGGVAGPKFIGPQPPSVRSRGGSATAKVHGPGDVDALPNYSLRPLGRGPAACALYHVDFGVLTTAPVPSRASDPVRICFIRGSSTIARRWPRLNSARLAIPHQNRASSQPGQEPARTPPVQRHLPVHLHA